jgi:hypothetical protein
MPEPDPNHALIEGWVMWRRASGIRASTITMQLSHLRRFANTCGLDTATPEQIITRLAPTRGGDIVLLHDGVAPNSIGRDPTATVRAIDPLLAMLRQRGLEPVAVPQLLERAMAS